MRSCKCELFHAYRVCPTNLPVMKVLKKSLRFGTGSNRLPCQGSSLWSADKECGLDEARGKSQVRPVLSQKLLGFQWRHLHDESRGLPVFVGLCPYPVDA